MNLQPILLQDLETLVGEELDWLTVNEQDFTAWDVTTALRSEHTDTETLHSLVRQIVHESMFQRIQQGLSYSAEQRDCNGTVATTYFYVDATQITPDQVAQGTVPTTPTALEWDSLLN